MQAKMSARTKFANSEFLFRSAELRFDTIVGHRNADLKIGAPTAGRLLAPGAPVSEPAFRYPSSRRIGVRRSTDYAFATSCRSTYGRMPPC